LSHLFVPGALRSCTNHLAENKTNAGFPISSADQDRSHRSAGDEKDGEGKLLTHSLTQPDIEFAVGAMSPPTMERSKYRSNLLDDDQ